MGEKIMDRTAYTNCMKPYMAGAGRSKAERQMDMCAGAKLCSNKASSIEEAEKICREAPPKEPKVKGGKVCSPKKIEETAACVIGKLEAVPGGVNASNLKQSMSQALQECLCSGVKFKTVKMSKTEKALAAMSPEQLKSLNLIRQVASEYGTLGVLS
jgi:hypothetical protein